MIQKNLQTESQYIGSFNQLPNSRDGERQNCDLSENQNWIKSFYDFTDT